MPSRFSCLLINRIIQRKWHKLILLLIGIVIIGMCYEANELEAFSKTQFGYTTEFDDNNRTIYWNKVIIFDFNVWRLFPHTDKNTQREGTVKYCIVPTALKALSNAICEAYSISPCDRLPCSMIFSKPKDDRVLECHSAGFLRNTEKSQLNNGSNHVSTCILSASLDHFQFTNETSANPSLLVHAYNPFPTKALDILSDKKRRSNSTIWGVYFNHESISYHSSAGNREKLKLFDISVGYDRQLFDLVPPPWLFNYLDMIISPSKRLPIDIVMKEKVAIYDPHRNVSYWPREEKGTFWKNLWQMLWGSDPVAAPILWINSNCNTKSNRTEYVTELMKYIPVDNYGTCGSQIRKLPRWLVNIQKSKNVNLKQRAKYHWEAGKLALSRRYLFTIAIENSITNDYVTEKLWHAFVSGSVPIYLGAPNIEDWLPCNNDCIIDLRKFKTPEEAANYINHVARNKTLYESFHRWRNGTLNPQFQKMLDYFSRTRDLNIECLVCDASYRVRRGETINSIKKQLKERIGSF